MVLGGQQLAAADQQILSRSRLVHLRQDLLGDGINEEVEVVVDTPDVVGGHAFLLQQIVVRSLLIHVRQVVALQVIVAKTTKEQTEL